MKEGKASMFISTFVIYSLVFLTWQHWTLTGKQIAEMIFIGTFLSLGSALMWKPAKRLLENALRKKFGNIHAR